MMPTLLASIDWRLTHDMAPARTANVDCAPFAHVIPHSQQRTRTAIVLPGNPGFTFYGLEPAPFPVPGEH